MAQPSMTGAELNEQLLSVLPPLDSAEAERTRAKAAVQTLNPTADAPSRPKVSFENPEPVPMTQAAPVTEASDTVDSIALQGEPQSLKQSQALAFANSSAYNSSANTHYGHYPYAEAYRENLTVAGYYGSRPEQLHHDASQAFQTMVAAAKQDGVNLMAISGFRDVGIQSELFAAQTARQGSPERAARISAPPGHSEHHTGFAIDVGDEGYPKTDIEVTFEQTPGFRWMAQNAAAYGFELSFPRGNAQGVSYEPWHWRFVGTTVAQQVFAQAR